MPGHSSEVVVQVTAYKAASLQAVDNLPGRTSPDNLEEAARACQWYNTVMQNTNMRAGGSNF